MKASNRRSRPRWTALTLALLLPVVSSCEGNTSGPATQLTQAQLIAAAQAIFSQSVVVAFDLPREPNSASGTEVIGDCAGSGTVSTTTFISGTSDPEAGTADLRYELGMTYDECELGSGSSPLELNTSATATGVLGDVEYQAFGTGEVEVEGLLIGRVEVRTEEAQLSCRVAYEFVGEGRGEDPSLTFSVFGQLCEAPFGFDLVVAG